MEILSNDAVKKIAGGDTPLVVVNVNIDVSDSAEAILQAKKILNEFGKSLGEFIFNITHPDPVGKMSYTVEDTSL